MAIQIGILSVRRSAFIAASPERVWEEFATFERMSAWFGVPATLPNGSKAHSVTRYEPGPNGYLEWDAGTWEGTRLVFGGRTIERDPFHEVSFEVHWSGAGWPAPQAITFRLTAALGGTVVEVIAHGYENLGPLGADFHFGAETGWSTVQLEALRDVVQADRILAEVQIDDCLGGA